MTEEKNDTPILSRLRAPEGAVRRKKRKGRGVGSGLGKGLDVRVGLALGLGDDVLRIGADETVGALGDGDRPFGVVPHGQAGHPQHRALLLHSTGVGEDHRGMVEQRHHVEVGQGVVHVGLEGRVG